MLLALAAFLLLPLLFWGFGGPYGGPYGMMGMMGWGWGFMPLVWLGFLVLIGVGAYYIFTSYGRPTRPAADSGVALEVLRERYARGEITREEYLKMKEELEA